MNDQGLQDEVQALEPQLQFVRGLADNLATDEAASSEVSAITTTLGDTSDRLERLNENIGDLLAKIEIASGHFGEFQVCCFLQR